MELLITDKPATVNIVGKSRTPFLSMQKEWNSRKEEKGSLSTCLTPPTERLNVISIKFAEL